MSARGLETICNNWQEMHIHKTFIFNPGKDSKYDVTSES